MVGWIVADRGRGAGIEIALVIGWVYEIDVNRERC